MQERRAARRYKLALQIEIKFDSGRGEFEPIFGKTRDTSIQGFYFRAGQRLTGSGASLVEALEAARATEPAMNSRLEIIFSSLDSPDVDTGGATLDATSAS